MRSERGTYWDLAAAPEKSSVFPNIESPGRGAISMVIPSKHGTHSITIDPKQTVNKYYDKHVSSIVDHVVSQDIHLRRLRDIQIDAKQ